jgi:hypothetical protein
MFRLLSAPAQTVGFVGGHLQPVVAADPQHVAALIKQLDSQQFAEREAASRELTKLGEAAEPALRKTLQENLPLETKRRVEMVLAKISGERLRTLRAIEILERIATKDARELLRRLADGAAGAWLTEESRLTLERLQQRAKVS